jgi:menaquinone-dependent protoporphyrinogen oxidase
MTPLNPTVTCEVPVFYATSEGQTKRIAERLAAVLREEGFDSRAIDVGDPEVANMDWTRVRGVVVGASLHRHEHQRSAALFVEAHAAELNTRPSVFFSVSLSAASRNPAEVEAARDIARAFPAVAGWEPHDVITIGGCLAYSHYDILTRLLMKHIARKEGAPTDTSRDYEMTDWAMVDGLGRDMAGLLRDVPWRARVA